MSKEFLAEVNEAIEEHKELLEKLGSKRPMIELTAGRSVKWQDGDAWFTGYVLNDEHGEAAYCGHRSDAHEVLVVHSNTTKVFAVCVSRLERNDFRIGEKLEELIKAVEEWKSSDKKLDILVTADSLLRRHKAGEDVRKEFEKLERYVAQ